MTRPAQQTELRREWLLLCAACLLLWGIWGFLSKLLADSVGAVAGQILFTLGMIPPALVALRRLPPRALVSSPRGVAYGLSNGLLTGLGTLAFMRALESGPAALVSPAIATYPLVTVAIAMTTLGERITLIQTTGAVIAVAGLGLLA